MGAETIALIAVSVTEGLLWLTWTRLYFTIGIPVFSRKLTAVSLGARVPTAKEVSERLADSKYPRLVFHDLGGNRLAFREKWYPNYTPVMHGFLVFDPLQAKVRVTGLANWYPLVFIVYFLLLLLSSDTLLWLLFLLFVVGIVAFVYRIQARRFTEAATAAVNAWSTVGHAG